MQSSEIYKVIPLLKRIPDDIIREHILPYTYSPQPKYICDDIRDYSKTHEELRQMYKLTYQSGYEGEDLEWLSNDIARFMNEDEGTLYVYNDFYIQFYRRMFRFQDADRDKIISYISNEESFPYPQDINRNLALMIPSERVQLKRFLARVLTIE